MLAQVLVWKAIAEEIQAICNANINNPTIREKSLTKTMNKWEEKLEGKFALFASSIYLNNDRRVESSIAVLKQQTPYTHRIHGIGIPNVQPTPPIAHQPTTFTNLSHQLPPPHQQGPKLHQHRP